MTTHLLAALDIGNGYIKGLIRDLESNTVDEIDLPSGVAMTTRGARLPKDDSEASQDVTVEGVHSLYSVLDANFVSPLVPDEYHRHFGARGISTGKSGGSYDEFNVTGNLSKAEQPLSKILVLGLCATKALRDHVKAHGNVPAALDAEVVLAVALPITEYRVHHSSYATSFKSSTHYVTIYNYKTPVKVALTFSSVIVVPEGASAQYAINDKGLPLMKLLLNDARSRGVHIDEDITETDLLGARDTIGIDIGEGTVNLPVFTDGEFNVDTSSTFNRGYGSALTAAMEALDDANTNMKFSSRKQLAEFLKNEPNPIRRGAYNLAKQYVNEQSMFFCQEVTNEFGKVLQHAGVMTSIVYVYGGGSGPIKDMLYPMLQKKAVEMTGDVPPLVLYLDASYSRHLNREGLYIAVQNAAEAIGFGKETKK